LLYVKNSTSNGLLPVYGSLNAYIQINK